MEKRPVTELLGLFNPFAFWESPFYVGFTEFTPEIVSCTFTEAVQNRFLWFLREFYSVSGTEVYWLGILCAKSNTAESDLPFVRKARASGIAQTWKEVEEANPLWDAWDEEFPEDFQLNCEENASVELCVDLLKLSEIASSSSLFAFIDRERELAFLPNSEAGFDLMGLSEAGQKTGAELLRRLRDSVTCSWRCEIICEGTP
ncbi:MAG: hypothetical protein Q4A17_04390 [Thermoguttaceae bacterium]|nr:hypothetical protein [Thermoguttaceae bacterium]